MRIKILIGFLLLVVVDTFVQIGFKLAGNSIGEPTLDLAWIEKVTREPWVLAVLAGYGAAFVIYMTILKYAPVGPAFAASHMEIVTVTLISWAWFGDHITAVQALGCCAIVGGVLLLAATEQGP
jgi:drug/metabolite transporter (DMT)-like permease